MKKKSIIKLPVFLIVLGFSLPLSSDTTLAEKESDKPNRHAILENHTTNSNDFLFESLLTEFARYSQDHEALFHLFYQLATEQKSLKYAMNAFSQANFLQDQTLLEKAGDLWLSLSENQSDKFQYYYIAIVASMNLNDIDKAKQHLAEIMTKTPNRREILNEIFIGFNGIYKQNQNDQYLDLIDYAIDYLDQKEKPDAYYESARLAFSWSNIDYALVFSKKALSFKPENIQYKMQRLSLLSFGKQNAQMLDYFNQAITPEDYDDLDVQLINIYLVNSFNAKSYQSHFQPLVEFLIATNQDTPLSRYMLALYSVYKNDIIKAQELLESVVDVDSDIQQAAIFNLASVYALNGNFSQSVETYKKITQSQYLEQANFFSTLIEGVYLEDDQAISTLKKYQEKNTEKFLDNIFKLVQAYQGHKKLNLVLDYLDFVLQHFKDEKTQIEVGLSQGSILYQLDNYQGFEDLIFNLLNQYPDSPKLLNAAGYYYLDHKKDTDRAEPLIVRAYELDSKNVAIIDSLGWLYFKRKDYQTALSLISKAYSISPVPEIMAHIVEILFNFNQEKQAEDLLIQALQKVPEDSYLLALKERLFPHLETKEQLINN